MLAWRRLRAAGVGLIPLILAVDFSACARRVPLPDIEGNHRSGIGSPRGSPGSFVSSGTRVTVLLKDGTRIEGIFRAAERIPIERYLAHAESLLEASGLSPPPPPPGSSISVQPHRGKPYSARLVSYGVQSLEL